jgi:UDP-N-acetylglucosamine transferase subunit ALG13
MIFVTVGTNEATFDRLLRAVAELEPGTDVVVQHGHSSALAPAGATLIPFLSFDEMSELVRSANAVVTHAGVGSILLALTNGKRPIVVPRRKQYGEAVDDHQVELGQRLDASGLVTLVDSPSDLASALERHRSRVKPVSLSSSLSTELRSFLAAAIGPSLGAVPQ